MTNLFRTRFITSTAPNLILAFNEIMVENARKGVDAVLQVPSIIDRAYMVRYETTIIPVIDYLVERQ